MIDLSNEEEQKEYTPTGPVPSGSLVVVRMEVLAPEAQRQAPEDHYVSVAQSGLRQLYCQFIVDRGQYEGVHWRQNITLPVNYQKIALTAGQQKAAVIGGATLKAILSSAGKRNSVIGAWEDMTGLKFPVKVKINNYPREKDGVTYWQNEIALVVTPDMETYAEVRQDGELINEDGAVVGNPDRARPKGAAYNGAFSGSEERREYAVDEVPF